MDGPALCSSDADCGGAECGPSLFDFADRFEEEGKASLMVCHQNWRSAGDALISCHLAYPPSDSLVKMLAAATGWELTISDLLQVGERILNLKRALNIRWGWNPENEKLPAFLMQPLEEGGTGGYVPDVERLLSEYYAARRWDRASGKPSWEKLLELGLEAVAADLY